MVVVVGGEIYFREGWLSFLSRGGGRVECFAPTMLRTILKVFLLW